MPLRTELGGQVSNDARTAAALAAIMEVMPRQEPKPRLPRLFRVEPNGDILSVVPAISGSSATFSMVRNGFTFFKHELPLSEARAAHDELIRRGFRKHVFATSIPLP